MDYLCSCHLMKRKVSLWNNHWHQRFIELERSLNLSWSHLIFRNHQFYELSGVREYWLLSCDFVGVHVHDKIICIYLSAILRHIQPEIAQQLVVSVRGNMTFLSYPWSTTRMFAGCLVATLPLMLVLLTRMLMLVSPSSSLTSPTSSLPEPYNLPWKSFVSFVLGATIEFKITSHW